MTKIVSHVAANLGLSVDSIAPVINEFIATCSPVEKSGLIVFVDARTKAWYCECHINAQSLIDHSTIDVPLDPEEQPDYRANREIVEDHAAYEKMKEDALSGRTFSNIVAEFTTSFNPEKPLKIIGGQHRFNAIAGALSKGVNELHGLKIYFGLDADQRLDVQLISNTNIAASTDLFDRMQETLLGPDLRTWCQKVGLLGSRQDFADKRQVGKNITVRAARTFILNYFKGKSVDAKDFDQVETTPIVCKSGTTDGEWEKLRANTPALWSDAGLLEAGRQFVNLANAQKKSFSGKSGTTDSAEKASNYAILAAWAFTAGLLHQNAVRIQRHYDLSKQSGKDPLNAAALAKGRHKTDPENYRGMGYRVDPKERGRFAELFFLQSEKGSGITSALINLAVMKYHAKQAVLEVKRAQEAT